MLYMERMADAITSEAASAMARARWAKRTPAERSQHASDMGKLGGAAGKGKPKSLAHRRAIGEARRKATAGAA